MRECGECSLCCKLAANPALGKPSNEWCQHCVPGNGCAIHDARPNVCRDFHCAWILDETMPASWQPHLAHMYVNADLRRNTPDVVQAHVDTAHPDAWREGPGKEIVDRYLGDGSHVVVITGRQINFIPSGKPPAKLVLEWLL